MSPTYLGLVLAAIVVLLHGLGVVSALHAVMKVRTPQGSIAWAISLVAFPYVSLPLYWVFGPQRHEGYVRSLRQTLVPHAEQVWRVRTALEMHRGPLSSDLAARLGVLERLAQLPFTRGNRVELLVDGQQTFEAILAGIESARSYVLVQFYIVRDDAIGRELKALLVRKAREGVNVHFLYDRVGSYRLPSPYLAELEAAGVVARAFGTGRGGRLRTQLNFRNHRKVVVVDGRKAFVGGLNVGDEYLGRSPEIGPWRDTHLCIEGPAVQGVQATFLADWTWARGGVLTLEWTPRTVEHQDRAVLSLATGPADPEETCALFFVQVISSARRRLWIATAYFVPDAAVFESLKLAALRGVDVRVLVPDRPDYLLVRLAIHSFLPAAERAGIGMWRYEGGFLHQKVLLVDDDIAAVGTANLDNRSLRLNFEITMLVADRGFAAEVGSMLERDFARSRPVGAGDFDRRSWAFRAAVKTARLFDPIL